MTIAVMSDDSIDCEVFHTDALEANEATELLADALEVVMSSEIEAEFKESDSTLPIVTTFLKTYTAFNDN